LEPSLADAAGEGLVAAVLAHVRDQVRGLAEGLSAYHALVRFLACNLKVVKIQFHVASEGIVKKACTVKPELTTTSG